MVKVRMKGDRFSSLPRFLRDFDERIGPVVRRVEESHWRHRQSLGGKTEAADVRDWAFVSEARILFE